ncbi:MAG: hypothetical protein L7U25_05395 [Candidatus Poseidonia sp.]|nr:hypothetical protein [Poseidonia sp.]
MTEEAKRDLAERIVKRLHSCGGKYYPAYGAIDQIVCVLDSQFQTQEQ